MVFFESTTNYKLQTFFDSHFEITRSVAVDRPGFAATTAVPEAALPAAAIRDEAARLEFPLRRNAAQDLFPGKKLSVR